MTTVKQILKSNFNVCFVANFKYINIEKSAHELIQSEFEDFNYCILSKDTFNEINENNKDNIRFSNERECLLFEGKEVIISEDIINDIIYIKDKNIMYKSFNDEDIKFIDYILIRKRN